MSRFDGIAGSYVTGFTKNIMPDSLAEAGRVPACILIDTSLSMKEYDTVLKNAAEQMIKAVASHHTAGELVDISIITFNTTEQISIKIKTQELYQLVDDNTKELKPEYKERLKFVCQGGTPTAYALKTAIDELRERYETLQKAKKIPKSPILFVLSDGLPEIQKGLKADHDRLLKEQIERVRTLVAENRLSVVAVEVGRICKEPENDWDRKKFPEMHQLMQDITGLNDNRHVRQAKDADNLAKFFEFTSTLLIQSATHDTNLNQVNLSRSEL